MPATLPLARQDPLVIERLNTELLAYDPSTHETKCLNEMAVLVWERCDGNTSAVEIAARIMRETNVPMDVSQVCYALDLLGKNHLLQERVQLPPEYARLTRRDLLRKAGVAGAAVAIPVIISLVAPTPAMAQTCVSLGFPNGSICNASTDCASCCCVQLPLNKRCASPIGQVCLP